MPALTLGIAALAGGIVAVIAGILESAATERKRRQLHDYKVSVVVDDDKPVEMRVSASATTSAQLAKEVTKVLSESSL